MGKADFYRKVGLNPPGPQKKADTEGGGEVVQGTDGRGEDATTASTCPSCGEAVGWCDLEVKQRRKARSFPLDFSPLFGLDESDMESYRDCPRCGYTEKVITTEQEDV